MKEYMKRCNTLEQVTDELKVHGKAIGKQAQEGNVAAANVISTYRMHHDSPSDPGAQGLLISRYNEYVERQEKVNAEA